MTSELTHASNDDYVRMADLLDERRKIAARHLRSKRLPGRSRLTLAEKLAIDRKDAAELAELIARIDELMRTMGNAA